MWRRWPNKGSHQFVQRKYAGDANGPLSQTTRADAQRRKNRITFLVSRRRRAQSVDLAHSCTAADLTSVQIAMLITKHFYSDGVSLINLPAVSHPADCPPAQSDIMCVNGAVACEPECKCQCFPGFSGDTCDTCTDSNADIAVGCEACKQGWVKGVYGQCTRCESGLDIRTGCTSCIPFLDADMCYGVNDACIPDIQRPEVSFITTHHTWTTDALEFASMPHALPHQVPAYLDNVCVAHGGMVYTFDRAASQVTIQPGQGNANVARTAISKWPWTLNVAFKSENVFCDDVQVTNYLNSHTYATTNVPDDLQWTCIEDAKGRYWVITTYEKMQVSSCTSSTTYADDVLRVLPTAGAFTPLTARLRRRQRRPSWAVTNKTTYYDCATDSNPWLFVLASSQCLHYDPGGSKVTLMCLPSGRIHANGHQRAMETLRVNDAR